MELDLTDKINTIELRRIAAIGEVKDEMKEVDRRLNDIDKLLLSIRLHLPKQQPSQ